MALSSALALSAAGCHSKTPLDDNPLDPLSKGGVFFYLTAGLAAWQSAGVMNTPRYDYTVTVLPDGRVLYTGGQALGSSFVNTAEIYDPATGLFTLVTGLMNVYRFNHTATLLNNGKVLIAGGSGGTNSGQLFDPQTQTFTTIADSINQARNGHTATLLNDGRVLICGGGNAQAELFDPAGNGGNGDFTTVGAGTMPGGDRTNHRATLLADGRVLITGGGSGSASAEIWAAGVFTATGSMTVARTNHTATLLTDGRVLITGGHSGGGTTYHSSAEVYSTTTNTFTAVSGMNSKRTRHAAIRLQSGLVLVAGGADSGSLQNNFMKAAELYNASAGTWTSITSMISAHYEPEPALLSDGKVLVTGIPTSSGTLNAGGPGAEVYVPGR